MREAYRYGVYEKALLKTPLPAMLDRAASLGFETFELSLDETDERLSRLSWTAADRRALRRSAEDAGVQLYSACFSGQRRFPMGSLDGETRRRSLALMEQAIHLCVDLGIRVLQVAGYDVYYEPRTPETGRRYLEGLARSAALAERYGVLLGIEPVEFYVTSVRRAMEIVEQIRSPNLQVYPDAANLLTEGFDPVAELALCRGHMLGLHIREATRKTCYNLPIGGGDLDFDGIYQTLLAAGFHGPIVVELWYQEDPAGTRILEDHLRFLGEREARARSLLPVE